MCACACVLGQSFSKPEDRVPSSGIWRFASDSLKCSVYIVSCIAGLRSATLYRPEQGDPEQLLAGWACTVRPLSIPSLVYFVDAEASYCMIVSQDLAVSGSFAGVFFIKQAAVVQLGEHCLSHFQTQASESDQ